MTPAQNVQKASPETNGSRRNILSSLIMRRTSLPDSQPVTGSEGGGPDKALPRAVKLPITSPAPVQASQNAIDERAMWIARAEATGVPIDKRWKLDRIIAAVENHK